VKLEALYTQVKPVVIERGEKFYEGGDVFVLGGQGTLFACEVKGFGVELNVLPGKGLGVYCQSGKCKGKTCSHIWACILIAEDDGWLSEVNVAPILTWHEVMITQEEHDAGLKVLRDISSELCSGLFEPSSGHDPSSAKGIMESIIEDLALERLPEKVRGGKYGIELMLNADDHVVMNIVGASGESRPYECEDNVLLEGDEKSSAQWIYYKLDDEEYIEDGLSGPFVYHASKLQKAVYFDESGAEYPLQCCNFADAELAFSFCDVEGESLRDLTMRLSKGDLVVDFADVVDLDAEGVFASGTWYTYGFGASLSIVDAIYGEEMCIESAEYLYLSKALHTLPGNYPVYLNGERQNLLPAEIVKSAMISCDDFVPEFSYGGTRLAYGSLTFAPGMVRNFDFEQEAIRQLLEAVPMEEVRKYEYKIKNKSLLIVNLKKQGWEIVELPF